MHQIKSRNILMIGIGATFTKDATNDNIQRHLDYAETSGVSIHQVAFAPEVDQNLKTSFDNKFFLYPSGAKSMFTFPKAAKKKIVELSKDIKFDLIYSQDPFGTAMVGLAIKKKLNIPLIIGNHSSFLDNKHWIKEKPLLFRYFNFLAKKQLPKADACRVINNKEKELYQSTLNIAEDKIHVINTPVNLQKFISRHDDEIVKNEKGKLGWTKNEKIIVWVGRPVKVKRLPLLLEVFKSIVKTCPEARLLIIGKKAQLQEDITAQLEDLTIKNKVHWLAKGVAHNRLSLYYQMADIYLHTSIYEGFGKTLAEASAAGLPIITTNTAGANMIVVHDKTGLVAPLEDADALASACLKLLKDSPRAKELGANGSRLVQEKYDYQKGVEKITSLWQKVMK